MFSSVLWEELKIFSPAEYVYSMEGNHKEKGILRQIYIPRTIDKRLLSIGYHIVSLDDHVLFSGYYPSMLYFASCF